jgi:hypothetical protein
MDATWEHFREEAKSLRPCLAHTTIQKYSFSNKGMTGTLLDGKMVAALLRQDVTRQTHNLKVIPCPRCEPGLARIALGRANIAVPHGSTASTLACALFATPSVDAGSDWATRTTGNVSAMIFRH